MRTAWEADSKIAVTLSLADATASRRAAEQVSHALDAIQIGYTLREGWGAWHGIREPSYTFEIVGDATEISYEEAVIAAHAAGCEAVQVELFGAAAVRGCGYEVREVRP